MKRIRLLPNVVTAFGLTCGLFVIFRTSMLNTEHTSYEVLQMSALILMLAGFADVLDGALARATQGESEFGSLFDSLSDAVSFGVAPAVLMLKNLTVQPGSEVSFLATAGALIYSVCGVLRLVRFNMTNPLPEKEAEEEAPDQKKHFVGLPIPAAAAAAVTLNLFMISPLFLRYVTLSHKAHACILTSVMFVLGYLMVSRWPFPSVKGLSFRVPSFQLVFATVIGAVFIFYGMLYHFSVVAVGLSWSYVLASLVLSMFSSVSKRG